MKQLVQAVAGGGSKMVKKIKVETPSQAPATPMPDPEAEKRAAQMEMMMRKKTGRSSTLLVDDESTL